MKLIKKICCRKGAALIISMIFVLVFSALAVSMATMSGTNLQLADNQRRANRALESAHSGLEVVRYLLDGMPVSNDENSSGRLLEVYGKLGDRLTETGMTIDTEHDTNLKAIRILSVNLDSSLGSSFSCEIKQSAVVDSILKTEVTGVSGQLNRQIIVDFNCVPTGHPIFDFGVATKGTLQMTGNVDLEGAKVDASVYIEAVGQETALELIGKCTIAGDVTIVDPCAGVQLSNTSSIGGQTGDAAMDHVLAGEAPVQFPVPDPTYFEHYVVEDINYPSTETTFENIRIPPDTNPSFSGGVTLRGIVFIEAPNVVTFTGNTTITGIIVGNGDPNDNSETNRIDFLGTVISYPVTDLPEETQFEQLRNETATFLMAPGFGVSFGGNFNTALNGTIAANGITFFGDAGGTIDGSVINYSDQPMILTGDNDLFFNRSGTAQMPAGFVPDIMLDYVPSSYSEVVF